MGNQVYTHLLSALSIGDYEDLYIKPRELGIQYSADYFTSRWKVFPTEIVDIYESEYLLNNDPDNGGTWEYVYNGIDRQAGFLDKYPCYVDKNLLHGSKFESLKCAIYKLCAPKYLVYLVINDDRLDYIRHRVNFVVDIYDNTIKYGEIKDKECKKHGTKRIK
jgi:hypothetical protein